jgi:hypothetical protein
MTVALKNEECAPTYRLHKMQALNDMCISKFQGMVRPGKNIFIHKTIVSFSGRLLMKQYIPPKSKMVFKFCIDTVYTWNVSIYAGKNAAASVPTNVVLKVLNSLVGCGKATVTKNCYTIVVLARKVLDCDASSWHTTYKQKSNFT